VATEALFEGKNMSEDLFTTSILFKKHLTVLSLFLRRVMNKLVLAEQFYYDDLVFIIYIYGLEMCCSYQRLLDYIHPPKVGNMCILDSIGFASENKNNDYKTVKESFFHYLALYLFNYIDLYTFINLETWVCIFLY
jgi:hypothetical protein